jgi:hypothetical protein
MTSGRAFSKNKNDSLNKETVDGSCMESQTFTFKQDSLNNSKGIINKNYSLSRPDNKIIIFSSSLKNELEKNKIINYTKNLKIRTVDSDNDNYSSYDYENNIINLNIKNDNDNYNDQIKEDEDDEEDTNRIDYRYYPKIPEIESNKDNHYYWLATYDKLMKKSKIIKILNYYTELSSSSKKNNEILIKNNDEESNKKDKNNKIKKYNFKEKSMILEGYEIYFLKKYNKPFIRPKKDGHIFIKLYLLSLDQINKIFSYINRLEYKSYINGIDLIGEKNYFKIINNSNKTIYNYSTIFFLGTFVNINIYLFSHYESLKKQNNKDEFNKNDLPSSNKLAKLIKVLLINFPDFSKEYFIDYLTKATFNDYNLENNEKDKELFEQKLKEISSLLLSINKKSLKLSKRNKYNANSVIKNVIQKIPTYTQSSHNTPNEFNNISENNNNISILNNYEKITYNNRYNNEINNTDFYNNINSELNIKPQKSEKNFKKVDINSLIKNKLNNIKISRSNQINHMDNNESKKSKKENNKVFFSKKEESISKSIKHISLAHQPRKSLTRYNTNKENIQYNIEEKLLNKTKKIKTNSNKLLNKNKNKENNIKILNSKNIALDNLNNFNSNNSSNNNNIILKTDVRLSNKKIRNISNLNPFDFKDSNANNINTNINYKTRNKKFKKPTRVISSIRKIISQKMNNVSGTTNSTNINNMSNRNNSIAVRKNDINHNNNDSNINFNCKTNNNSKNKISEYVTPRKKKLRYYYH